MTNSKSKKRTIAEKVETINFQQGLNASLIMRRMREECAARGHQFATEETAGHGNWRYCKVGQCWSCGMMKVTE